MFQNYQQLRQLLTNETYPLIVVDLDVLTANTQRIAQKIKAAGKSLRIATKSIRVPYLISLIQKIAGPTARGLMCFSMQEADQLSQLGFDDLLIAYPTVQPQELKIFRKLIDTGKKVTLMVDHEFHLEPLKSVASPAQPLPVCIDIDMSYRLFNSIHLGVYRSSIRNIADFSRLLDRIQNAAYLQLAGIMGYEAQIAGLPDQNPFSATTNFIKKWVRQRSKKIVYEKRKRIVELLNQKKISLDFFNGGGTGSLTSTLEEPWISEVTAGSGFLQSHLFDYYQDNVNEPAFCFGLPITRIPEKGIVTCQSGGFIASGTLSPDKAPQVFLPKHLEPISNEGFGEVQTPLKTLESNKLSMGDPIFFRPAKAGEIAERFNEYVLIQGGQIVDRVKTYRGLGWNFF
ncbi:MAG: alanine racemase [Deltaproteobacteria bacterium]|nr:alanine racemase [Deltaproteobacteria bacterium]